MTKWRFKKAPNASKTGECSGEIYCGRRLVAQVPPDEAKKIIRAHNGHSK